MASIPQERTREVFRLIDEATTSHDRGRALEDLIEVIFGSIPGLSVEGRDILDVFRTEEIDVMFFNNVDPEDLNFLPNWFFVECKNWSAAVGSDEVAFLDRKLQDHGLDFGVLVALNGITGDPTQLTSARQIIATALRERRRIIVLTRDDLERLLDSHDAVNLIKGKLGRLHAMRSSI